MYVRSQLISRPLGDTTSSTTTSSGSWWDSLISGFGTSVNQTTQAQTDLNKAVLAQQAQSSDMSTYLILGGAALLAVVLLKKKKKPSTSSPSPSSP